MKKITKKHWWILGISLISCAAVVTTIILHTKTQDNFKNTVKTFNNINEISNPDDQNNLYVSNQQILQDLNYDGALNYQTKSIQNLNGINKIVVNQVLPTTNTFYKFNLEANDLSMLQNTWFRTAASIISTNTYQTQIPLLTFANNAQNMYANWNLNYDQLAHNLVQNSNVLNLFTNIQKQTSDQSISLNNAINNQSTANGANLWTWYNTKNNGSGYTLGSYRNGPFVYGANQPSSSTSATFYTWQIPTAQAIGNNFLAAQSGSTLMPLNWWFKGSDGAFQNSSQQNQSYLSQYGIQCLAYQLNNYFNSYNSTPNQMFGQNNVVDVRQHNWLTSTLNNHPYVPNVNMNFTFALGSPWTFSANLFLFNATYPELQNSKTLFDVNANTNTYNPSLNNTNISDFYDQPNPQNNTYFLNNNFSNASNWSQNLIQNGTTVLGNQNTVTNFSTLNLDLKKFIVVNTINPNNPASYDNNATSTFYNFNNNQIQNYDQAQNVKLSFGWNTPLMNSIYQLNNLGKSLESFLDTNNANWLQFNNPDYTNSYNWALNKLVNGILLGQVSPNALNQWINNANNNKNLSAIWTYKNQNNQEINVISNQALSFWNELQKNGIDPYNSATQSAVLNQTLMQKLNLILSWQNLWSYLVKQTFNQKIYVNWSPNNTNNNVTSCIYSPDSGWKPISLADANVGLKVNSPYTGIDVKNIWFQSKNQTVANSNYATINTGQNNLTLQNIYQTTQELNQAYPQTLYQLQNNLWNAQNNLSQTNPIVYLNYDNKNSQLNFATSFVNTIQGAAQSSPFLANQSFAVVNNLKYWNTGLMQNKLTPNEIALDIAKGLELIKKSGNNGSDVETTQVGSELGITTQNFANMINISFLNTNNLNQTKQSIINSNKYPFLTKFYKDFTNAKAEQGSQMTSESNFSLEIEFSKEYKALNELPYFYVSITSSINLLNYLTPAVYQNMIQKQWIIPISYYPDSKTYGYFIQMSSAYKPLNFNVQQNQVVNSLSSNNADNVLMSLQKNQVINTTNLQTQNIEVMNKEISDLATTLNQQTNTLNQMVGGGWDNKNNELNQAYANTVSAINKYLNSGNLLLPIQLAFQDFARELQNQIYTVAKNFKQAKDNVINDWHGIQIGKKLDFNYKTQLLQMKQTVANAESNFLQTLKKQGQWEQLKEIVQTNYLDKVNEFSQMFNQFSANLIKVKSLNQSINKLLNQKVGVMKGAVLTFNLNNWEKQSGFNFLYLQSLTYTKPTNPQAQWYNYLFWQTPTDFMNNLNAWLKSQKVTFLNNQTSLTLNDLYFEMGQSTKDLNGLTEYVSVNSASKTITYVFGKQSDYVMIDNGANKVNPIDVKGFNSYDVNSFNPLSNNDYVNQIIAFNNAVKNAYNTFNQTQTLINNADTLQKSVQNLFATPQTNSFVSVQNVNNFLSQKADNLVFASLMSDPTIVGAQPLIQGANENWLPKQFANVVNDLATNPANDLDTINNAVANYQNYQHNFARLNWVALGLIIGSVALLLIFSLGLTYRYLSSRKRSRKDDNFTKEEIAQIQAAKEELNYE